MKSFIQELHKRNNILFWLGFMHFILLIICLGLMASDRTLILDENAWMKPVKYSFSSAIMSWTLGWILHYLKSLKTIRISSWLITICFMLKISIIFLQSFRGVSSHYNYSNPFNSMLYNSIIISDALFMILMMVITYIYFTQKKMPVSQHYTWGIRMGFLNFSILSVSGLSMHLRMNHLIGGIAQSSRGLVFLNWSTRLGDLRIVHFLGIHALQIIPLTCYFLFEKKSQSITFSILYLTLGLLLYVLSMSGISIF